MEKGKRFHVATSGWYYSHWKGPFYPEDIPEKRFLEYYSRYFDTVELNNSFYRLPEEKTLARWRCAVPKDFIFSVKASRLITHMKKLKDPDKTLPPFLDRVKVLKEKLGPILFQLPPGWGLDLERIEGFLDFLSFLPDYRYTIEFRNTGWFDKRVYELLSSHNVAFCIYDLNQVQSPKEVTADFVYIRLHGPDGSYMGSYPDETLNGWAGFFFSLKRRVRDVYCYFDNDEAGYAPRDALRLKGMIKGRT